MRVTATDSPPGDADPLIALWAERSRLAAQLRALADEEAEGASAQLIDSLLQLEDQISSAIPLAPAGAVVQLRLLREQLDSDPFAERLADNLIAGLERLGDADA